MHLVGVAEDEEARDLAGPILSHFQLGWFCPYNLEITAWDQELPVDPTFRL